MASLTVSMAGTLSTAYATSVPGSLDEIIATGYLPEQFGLEDVEVELLPIITADTPFGELPTYFIDNENIVLGPDNELVVTLSPEEVPSAFQSAVGMVDPKIDAASDGLFWTTTLTAQAISQQGVDTQWVDPADFQALSVPSAQVDRCAHYGGDHRVRGDDVTTLEPPRFASAHDVPDYGEDAPPLDDDTWDPSDNDDTEWDGGTMTPQAVEGCPGGGMGPHKTEYLSNKKAWATIGTSYPIGDSKAWMKVTTSSGNGAKYGARSSS
ncbi:MAG: hypothetical protein HZY75_02840 [Nocardioidaceae bacterium]|nr:MAG: hypothetical protein HZY75_02840 [Nocardioidaceae bacterium]